MLKLSNAKLTVAEAAFVADLPVRAIDHEIDARVVRSSGGKRRSVSGGDVVYLRAVREIRSDLALSLRKQLRNAIVEAVRSGEEVAKIGRLQVRLEDIAATVLTEVRWLGRVKSELIESNPAIMGGEPVLRGTRVPVRLVTDLVKRAMSREEIEEELDLSIDQIEAAVTYDRVTPRRGRPRLERREVASHVSADR